MDPEQAQRMRETGLQLIQKALAVLQIFALSQFGCAAGHVPQNMWSQGAEAQDYGPLLQKLEGAVECVRLQASFVYLASNFHCSQFFVTFNSHPSLLLYRFSSVTVLRLDQQTP